MAQLQQYWTNGFNDPKYVHKARLVIPNIPSQPSNIVLSPPTLQDLLNPVPVDGPDNVDFPDATIEELYGATFDEGDDDESPPITFVRGADLERLAIEALVDLANPKLVARFQDNPEASGSPTTAQTTNNEPPNTAAMWSEADAQWASGGDLDW